MYYKILKTNQVHIDISVFLARFPPVAGAFGAVLCGKACHLLAVSCGFLRYSCFPHKKMTAKI